MTQKKTGYRMANRPLGYRGKLFEAVCFQRQLRDSLDTGDRWELSNPQIREIDFHTAQDFILKYEWLGSMGVTKFSYGLYIEHNGEEKLAAVVCFGVTAGTKVFSEPFGEQWRSKGIVLVRGAAAPEAHAHSASFLIGNVMSKVAERGYRFVVAYSDPEAGEIGTIYQATNWKFFGLTNPVSYLIRPDNKRVDPKLIYKYAKKFGITRQQQIATFVAEGYTFQRGARKLKYLKIIGDKRQQKEILKDVRVQFYPYMKRPVSGDMREVYKQFLELRKTVDIKT